MKGHYHNKAIQCRRFSGITTLGLLKEMSPYGKKSVLAFPIPVSKLIHLTRI